MITYRSDSILFAALLSILFLCCRFKVVLGIAGQEKDSGKSRSLEESCGRASLDYDYTDFVLPEISHIDSPATSADWFEAV